MLSKPQGRKGEREQGRIVPLPPLSLSPLRTTPQKTLRSLLSPAHFLTGTPAQKRRLPPSECVEIGLALTTALAHLHSHGLVHRDIKPSNIIFAGGVPKLADIGLVTDVDASRSFVGTEGFLPPEGPGTPQADLYSLGKVLYEMSTGRDRKDYPALPLDWDALDPAEQARLLELNEVLVKVCEADPRRRYQTAEELGGDLALLQHGKSVRSKHARKRRWTAVKRVGLVAAAVTGIAGSAGSSPPPSILRNGHRHSRRRLRRSLNSTRLPCSRS